ncbi:MAG TPA: nickel-dependent lactate racemase [Dialister sp.]|nr:nickel-dependent lactate racemase [Dialister sp.]
MNYQIKYFKDYVPFQIEETHPVQELLSKHCPAVESEEAEVKRALAHPIDSQKLSDIVKPGEKIVIITSDVTRPVPSWVIVSCLLEELEKAHISMKDVTIVFGLGSHRPMTEEEHRRLVGDAVYEKVTCIDSNPDDCIHMGTCQNGTSVDIFRTVAEADRRILVGNVEYHYFAGYSGGMKAIMPGVASRESIQSNHKNMIRPGSYAGNLEGNPVRDDIEEVAKYCPVDFIVNVVLDDHKQIAYAAAGHPVAAHRKACHFLDEIYKIQIEKTADVVIVSTGGYPKDINLYQAQKSIDNAKHAVREGGIMVVAASCKEGYGSDTFGRWIQNYDTPEERIQAIHEHFELGGHKSAALGLVQQKCTIHLVTDMDDALVEKVNMVPFHDLQTAIDAAFAKMGKDASAYIIPIGGSTLPMIKKQ